MSYIRYALAGFIFSITSVSLQGMFAARNLRIAPVTAVALRPALVSTPARTLIYALHSKQTDVLPFLMTHAQQFAPATTSGSICIPSLKESSEKIIVAKVVKAPNESSYFVVQDDKDIRTIVSLVDKPNVRIPVAGIVEVSTTTAADQKTKVEFNATHFTMPQPKNATAVPARADKIRWLELPVDKNSIKYSYN